MVTKKVVKALFHKVSTRFCMAPLRRTKHQSKIINCKSLLLLYSFLERQALLRCILRIWARSWISKGLRSVPDTIAHSLPWKLLASPRRRALLLVCTTPRRMLSVWFKPRSAPSPCCAKDTQVTQLARPQELARGEGCQSPAW